MPPPDNIQDSDDLADAMRSQDEPADDWQPATPQEESGYGIDSMPGIDPIPAKQRYEDGYTVDVSPADLQHFSQMLGLDTAAFLQSQRDALDAMAPVYPNFSGVQFSGDLRGSSGEERQEAIGALEGTAMPEGWAFQATYLRSHSMLQQLLGDSLAGLLYLTHGSQLIDLEYQMADFFNPGGRSGGFDDESGYHADLVNSMFNPDQELVQERDDGLSEQAEQEWDDILLEEEEGGEGEAPPESEPLLASDADPRGAETRHEGQPGEYTAETDQESVEWFDQADGYTIDAPTGDDAHPDDITVFHPETSERWHNV